MYVISPRLMVEEADSTIERINGLIQDAGGEVLLTDNWGRRRLAYPIKHHFEGTYVLTHMTLPPSRVAGFERELHINESILRHLVIRGIVPGYEGPPEEELVGFGLDEIAERRPHALSRMPSNLRDTLDREQVLDLLAYLLAGPAPAEDE